MGAAIAAISENSGWISAAMSVASGLMQMAEGSRQSSLIEAQGRQQADSLRFQGELALLQGQQKSLSYKREELNAKKQANDITERLMRANSAAIARAAATNLNPFTGSPLNLQLYNDKTAMSEKEIADMNAEGMASGGRNALGMAQLQRDSYMTAADNALETARIQASNASSKGLMGGLMTIGGGIFNFAKLGGAPAGANSLYSIDRVNSFDDGSMMRAFR